MDTKSEIREFLTSRRARLTPDRAGLPVYGDDRRVPGLRREEVAVLAGVSVPYYTRLERGNMSGVSEGVLEALTRALQLDEAERSHLFDLARAAQPLNSTRRRRPSARLRPTVQWILDGMSAPALVRNGRLDIVAGNQLGYALYAPMLEGTIRPANTARFAFLDPRAREFYPEWDRAAADVVAVLRSEAGRDPHDRGLQDLVGELSTQSEEFRALWAAHNVRFHVTGVKRLRHPVVGDLQLSFERMDLSADTGLTVFAYAAEPGSASEQALNLLASWAATPDQEPVGEQGETAQSSRRA